MRRPPLALACAITMLPVSSIAAMSVSWEIPIAGAQDSAYVSVDSSGNPRVIFHAADGLLHFMSFTSGGQTAIGGVTPASPDGRSRVPYSAMTSRNDGESACGYLVAPVTFDQDALAASLSNTGQAAWTRTLSDADLGLCGFQALHGCTISNGDIFGVGTGLPPPPSPFPGPPPTCPFIPTNVTAFLIRLDGTTGTTTALKTFNAIADGVFYTAVASTGDVIYALGSRGGMMTLDRYDPNLTLVWASSAPFSTLAPVAVAVSSRGEVAVLGQRGTLDSHVFRIAPDGALKSEIVVPFAEATAIALTDGATVYVSGRITGQGAALARVDPLNTVTMESADPTAVRYLNVAVAPGQSVFTISDRSTELHLIRLSGSTTSAGGLLSISTGTDNQIGDINTPLPLPLEVLLSKSDGSPAGGIQVTFSVSSEPVSGSGATVNPSMTASSLPDGKAKTDFTVGRLPFKYQISCTCPTCGPQGSSATFSACGQLPNDHFSQADVRWSTQTYGSGDVLSGTDTIRRLGCGLTSLSMLSNYYQRSIPSMTATDPAALNSYLQQNGGYVGTGSNPQRQTLLDWTFISDFTGGNVVFNNDSSEDADPGDATAEATLLSTAEQDLAVGRPVIFHVNHRLSSGTLSSHFVLVTGKCGDSFITSDPGTASRRQFAIGDPDFQFIGIRRFRRR